jgi:hypothetical protein
MRKSVGEAKVTGTGTLIVDLGAMENLILSRQDPTGLLTLTYLVLQ